MCYICDNCSKRFTYPKEIVTSYENYIGALDVFPTRTPFKYLACPFCESEEIERENEDEE